MILRRQQARVKSEPMGQVASSGVCLVRPRMVAVVSITERSNSGDHYGPLEKQVSQDCTRG